MRQKKRTDTIITYAIFIGVSIFGFYGYFSYGNIIGLIIGIITLLFISFIIFTKINHKIKSKQQINPKCVYFKTIEELSSTLKIYNPSNMFNFIADHEEKI